MATKQFGIFSLLFIWFMTLAPYCLAEDISPAPLPAGTEGKLVPDHQIKYQETLSPDWKMNWDLARGLYREKKYPEALIQYEILFTQKADIDEARWEYVSILMYLSRWENAKTQLEKLLTAEPASVRYQLAMARVCMETGNLDKAVLLYSQILELPVNDAEKKQVLEGLVQTYELQGKAESAVEPLTQLVAQDPDNPRFKLKLAALELGRGNVNRARELCLQVEQKLPRDVAVLSMQAQIENALNNKDSSATYWQKVIGLDPNNAEAHKKLYEYYLANGNLAMSSSHLEQLIRMAPNDTVFLQRAAELNIQLGRIDRALEYYEFALAVDPQNQEILEGKDNAQKMLAHDLLELIENDVDKKVWQDLSRVAPDRVGVYREVANLLRDKGKVNELINVLYLLNRQVPDDQQVRDELATLFQQQGMTDELAALQEAQAELEATESTSQ